MSKHSADYLRIAKHYEACLERHGDTPKGVDWPNKADMARRHAVMLGVIRERQPDLRLLDVGCGLGYLCDHLAEAGIDLNYTGLDLSRKFVDRCRARHPRRRVIQLDLLQPNELERFDYAILNGVFTVKADLAYESMREFMEKLLIATFSKVDIGMAFNVMSKYVDWERDDLFHVPFDELAGFLTKQVSRHYTFRADYGLYEYTVYVYRSPNTEVSE